MSLKFSDVKTAKQSKLELNKEMAIDISTRGFETMKFIVVNKISGLDILENKVSGVYILFAKLNGRISFSYVGVSNNIKSRLKTHKRNLENGKKRTYKSWLKILNNQNQNIEDLYFGIILNSEDEQERFKFEIINIMKVWNKFTNANKRLRDRQYHCIFCGGGMVNASCVSEPTNELLYGIKIKCITKLCKKQYMLK